MYISYKIILALGVMCDMSTEEKDFDTNQTVLGFNGNQDLGENQPWGNKKSCQVFGLSFHHKPQDLSQFLSVYSLVQFKSLFSS